MLDSVLNVTFDPAGVEMKGTKAHESVDEVLTDRYWSAEALPPDTTFVNRVGQCAIRSTQADGVLTVQRDFVLKAPAWNTEQYGEVKKLFEARQAFSSALFVLTQGPPAEGTTDSQRPAGQ